MTREQYQRWVDFASRMARNYPNRSRATRDEIESTVLHLIELITCDGQDIESLSGWDDKRNAQGFPCDYVSEYELDYAAARRAPRSWRLDGADGDTAAYRQWLARYWDPVVCCVRAGIDMAGEPSAGVVGFTVGDLRRWYPEGLPQWVLDCFDGNIATARDAEAVLL